MVFSHDGGVSVKEILFYNVDSDFFPVSFWRRPKGERVGTERMESVIGNILSLSGILSHHLGVGGKGSVGVRC